MLSFISSVHLKVSKILWNCSACFPKIQNRTEVHLPFLPAGYRMAPLPRSLCPGTCMECEWGGRSQWEGGIWALVRANQQPPLLKLTSCFSERAARALAMPAVKVWAHLVCEYQTLGSGSVTGRLTWHSLMPKLLERMGLCTGKGLE